MNMQQKIKHYLYNYFIKKNLPEERVIACNIYSNIVRFVFDKKPNGE